MAAVCSYFITKLSSSFFIFFAICGNALLASPLRFPGILFVGWRPFSHDCDSGVDAKKVARHDGKQNTRRRIQRNFLARMIS